MLNKNLFDLMPPTFIIAFAAAAAAAAWRLMLLAPLAVIPFFFLDSMRRSQAQAGDEASSQGKQ
jgi:hypothetical protein